MFAYRFSSDRFDTLRTLFAPRKPRHPLLRLAFALVGVALLAVLVVVGLFVGAAMLVGGMLLRLVRPRAQPVTRDVRVVEGEYRVVGKPVVPLGR